MLLAVMRIQVLTMESVVLNALRFNLTAVTPYTFVRRIATLLSLRSPDPIPFAARPRSNCTDARANPR
eukprot:3058300-Rhodomonas_salina.2